MARNLFPLALLLLIAATARSIGAEVTLEVAAGKHDRVNTPVSWELDQSLKKRSHLVLTSAATGKRVAAQVSGGARPRLVWLLREPLSSGMTRRYLLAATDQRSASAKGVSDSVSDSDSDLVSVSADGKQLKVSASGKPVLAYNTAVVRSPDRKQSFYDRSGYIHPIHNPRGEVVTDDFAPDHPHQHGLMFPWTNATFEGRPVNFWDQQKGKGVIEHARVVSKESGPVFGGFAAQLKHLDITNADKPKAVLQETWRVRVFNLSDYFLFDLVSVQRCLGSPLRIQKYHYGGLAIRGHRNWLKRGQGDFLTSENKSRKNGNQTRPRWCDIHGQIDGRATGVTIFCAPDNFRAPQPVRLHPEKPYFCFAPMALGAFKIESGKPYVSRYRFYVHNGPLDPRQAERLWRDLADPPRVKLVAKAGKQ